MHADHALATNVMGKGKMYLKNDCSFAGKPIPSFSTTRLGQ